MTWKIVELIGGGIEDADSEGDLLTISVGTPAGLVHIMADIEFENEGRRLVLKGVHIHSEGGPRSIGIANFRVLADFILAKVNWMKPSSRERLAPLGPIRVISPVPSGSPAVIVLRMGPKSDHINSIAAIHALVRRGVKIRRAKRAVETMIEKGEAVVNAPTVEPGGVLSKELRAAGVEPARVMAEPIDIAALRVQLELTQEEFALRYNFSLRALQNWEQGREPDAIVRSYLRAIESDPVAVARALEGV